MFSLVSSPSDQQQLGKRPANTTNVVFAVSTAENERRQHYELTPQTKNPMSPTEVSKNKSRNSTEPGTTVLTQPWREGLLREPSFPSSRRKGDRYQNISPINIEEARSQDCCVFKQVKTQQVRTRTPDLIRYKEETTGSDREFATHRGIPEFSNCTEAGSGMLKELAATTKKAFARAYDGTIRTATKRGTSNGPSHESHGTSQASHRTSHTNPQ